MMAEEAPGVWLTTGGPYHPPVQADDVHAGPRGGWSTYQSMCEFVALARVARGGPVPSRRRVGCSRSRSSSGAASFGLSVPRPARSGLICSNLSPSSAVMAFKLQNDPGRIMTAPPEVPSFHCFDSDSSCEQPFEQRERKMNT